MKIGCPPNRPPHPPRGEASKLSPSPVHRSPPSGRGGSGPMIIRSRRRPVPPPRAVSPPRALARARPGAVAVSASPPLAASPSHRCRRHRSYRASSPRLRLCRQGDRSNKSCGPRGITAAPQTAPRRQERLTAGSANGKLLPAFPAAAEVAPPKLNQPRPSPPSPCRSGSSRGRRQQEQPQQQWQQQQQVLPSRAAQLL